MIKTLNKFGNSHGLILDKALLEILQIKSDTNLLITTDGDSIIITPQRKIKEPLIKNNRYKLKLLSRTNKK